VFETAEFEKVGNFTFLSKDTMYTVSQKKRANFETV